MLMATAAASASTVAVRFFSNGQLVLVERSVPAEMSPVEAAVRSLVAGPTEQEIASGLSSMIPAGVSVNKIAVADTSVEIDMSSRIVTGLDEAVLQDIFNQFRTTLGDFQSISTIKLTCSGKLLSSYLPVAPTVGGPPATTVSANDYSTLGVGLGGRNITIGPSHGRFWNGSGWYWQRSDPCGFGEAVLEDTNSIRLCQFLYQYLTQDGATVHVPRELNESNCCNGDTGLAWWKMCAESWLRANGLPCSVWGSYSGNCGGDTAVSRSSDDIRARPLFADYRGSEIYIAHHTNAGGGGTANGTETYRDTTMEHSAHVNSSYNLALSVHNNTIDAIRDMYDGGWSNRGVKDSAGGFGEIRIPDRPACLIELAFHDNCSRDGAYLTDDFFRSVAEWGLYKGICAYFGNTPTWDKYSDEYVSDTIPATMNAGQSYNVSVTLRNRGVCWSEGRAFRLGAAGDSDPFTGTTRHTISGSIKPGSTYTFNFTLTAPVQGGTYTTDWQMVRDGVAWFGPTVTKTVTVNAGNDTQAPSVPQNLRSTGVTSGTITLAWDASTDNVGVAGYRIYRNGLHVGNAAGASYTDTSLLGSTTYSYQVDAYDGVPNYSAKSSSIQATTSQVVVADPAEQTGSGIGSWTGDRYITPSSFGGGWATATDCGTYWYCYSHFTSCAARGFNVTYNPGFVWSGRGWIHMDYVNPGAYAYTNDILRYRNQDGGLTGATTTWNTCSYACSWQPVLDGYTDNVYNWNGIYLNADESTATSGCGNICGSAATATREIHMYGSRYQYINDWTCLGPCITANPGAIADNPVGLDEANLYLYPAVDTTHGNVLRFGSTNLVPGRVTTGDCNNANSLNFKGNAAAYGGDYCSSYGFAWVYAPAGAGPKFNIASDDGNRVWVNGALINDNNSFRGLSRDSDVTGGIGLGAGWNRVLFKVHSGTGGFEGTISLRNGGDNRANEPSIRVFDLGGYLSYGLGYEQDAWYPHIDVANISGVSNPQAGSQIYTNNTTIVANGTTWQVGPVPLWKEMHFEWGYGISGDTNYTDVTTSGTNWSHTQTGVTGHRRFHFFAVSNSHRTSFQSGTNSGKNGGYTWSDGGPANYMDVYVDNLAPQTPGLTDVAATGPNQVSLAWAIPLDEGVNVAAGSTESADATSGGTNHYRAGNVGVQVRRNAAGIYGWGTDTGALDTGLDSNTEYTYDIAARDNTSQTRGAWNNTTGYVDTTAVYTLAEAPSAGVNIAVPTLGTYRPATWPGVTSGSFGASGNHKITKFMYKWSTVASDSIAEGQGTEWSSGTMTDLPTANGTYYLYVRSYNAASVGNGSTKFGPYEIQQDIAAPTIVSVTSPACSNTSPITVSYSVTDTESGIKQVTLWAKKGSGVWATTGQTSASATGSIEYTVSEEDTYYFGLVAEDNAENATADPSGDGDTHTLYDMTAPTADVTLTPESSGTVNFLKGKVTVEVTNVADTGGSDVQNVEMKVDDGSYSELTESGGEYTDDTTTITSSWANGAHSITVKVTDNAGNYVEIVKDFSVNKNEIAGFVAMQGFVLTSVSRPVTFVLTYTQDGTDYTITRTVASSFSMGRANYSLTDVPDGIKAISAKTAWSLRKRIATVPENGQATVDFTGTLELPGGDLATAGFPNGDNVVNALDYSALRNAWGQFGVGDITGDGWTNNADYLILKSSWYKRGDVQ